MARTAISVTVPTRAGIAQPATQNSDHTNGMYIPTNNGKIFLEVKNNNASTQTIAFPFKPSATIDGVSPADKSVSITASSTVVIGPFPTAYYNQTDGSVYVNPSVDTDLKIRAYQVS